MKFQIFNWVIEIHSQVSWQKAALVSRLEGVKAHRQMFPTMTLKAAVAEVDNFIERSKK
jgi:hypothetical protein